MMINQVADELGVDPDSSVMDDVLTAVSTIASEDDVISVEVRAARKIANWWRHTKRRKQGLVKEKFPPVLDMIEERDDDTALKSKIRYALLCFIPCAGRAWSGVVWSGLVWVGGRGDKTR